MDTFGVIVMERRSKIIDLCRDYIYWDEKLQALVKLIITHKAVKLEVVSFYVLEI